MENSQVSYLKIRITHDNMDDAIKTTIGIMQAPSEQIKIRSSYNLAAMSFTPKQIGEEIKKHYPNFELSYNLISVRKLPIVGDSIDDTSTREDWGWKNDFDLKYDSGYVQNLKENIYNK